MIRLYEFFQIRRAHIFLLLPEGIGKIKPVDSKLVRHDHIDIIRHSARHPVMSADCLQPPDLILILKCNAVHLIGAVLLQQASQTSDTLSGAADIRKYKAHKIFLADPSTYLRLTILCLLVYHQRICAEHARIRGDRLRRRHGNMCLIHAACRPDTFPVDRIRHRRVAHRLLRQLDLHM